MSVNPTASTISNPWRAAAAASATAPSSGTGPRTVAPATAATPATRSAPAATGSADPFQNFAANLQALILQLQAASTRDANETATGTGQTAGSGAASVGSGTAAGTTAAASSVNTAAQALSAAMRQALQSYGSATASGTLPPLTL